MAQASSSTSAECTEQELKKMVLTFRVHELQHLLGFANKNKNGKKTELLNRALDLIKSTRSLQVQQKVRELFRLICFSRRFPEQRYPNEAQPNGDQFNANFSVSPPAYSSNSSSSSTYPTSAVAAAATFLNQAGSFGSLNNMIVDSHPDVKFIRLPFFDLITTLVRPTLLRPLSAQKYQENYIAFTLTAEQLREIAYPESAPLPRVEVQLRFCLLDLTCDQKDDFPSGIEVRMNDKVVQLPNPIPTNKPGLEPKRPSRPVNITPYCKTSQPQRVYIHWAADTTKNWVVGVVLVKKVTSTILLQRLKEKGLYPAQNSRNMIKKNLASDNEIATTSLRVSLHCPLGKMRMQIPCRLKQCKHLQCFDADLFLRMNEKKPTWVCPVCDGPTPFEDLMIDGYFTEVLLKSDRDVSEIELFENGDWIRVDKDDSDDSDSSSPRPRCDSSRASAASTDIRSNSNSADTFLNSKALPPSRHLNKNSSSSPIRASSSSNIEPSTSAKDNSADVVIDLTEESDDEESATVTTTNRSPSSVKLRASSLSQSCSTSPSESIIVLDSPPSRPNATPDDPVENFIRASQNIMNSPSLPTAAASSTQASSASTVTTNHNRHLSPPKKRFKPVSPLVTSGASTTTSTGIYNNNLAQTTASMSNQVSRSNSVNCTPNNLPAAIDYSTSSAAYNTYRQNYYHQTPNHYVESRSPLLHSPYGGMGGADVSSSTPSMMMPHSAPPMANGSTNFFAQQHQQQPPPPLHYGPSSAAMMQQQANYLNMFGFGQQHTRLPSVLHNSYGVDQHATNNLGDYFPLMDSRVQAEYQKFINSYVNETNGTS